MVDWICEYYAGVADRPVRSQVQPGYLAPRLPEEAPESGEPWEDIMSDVEEHIMPGEHLTEPSARPAVVRCKGHSNRGCACMGWLALTLTRSGLCYS